ncbi:TetR/AcrR family transcriptional regulator [Micromonospora radicis]|nr:TetR/AcrR family transcriptional regulator [Micromonospora radicis]
MADGSTPPRRRRATASTGASPRQRPLREAQKELTRQRLITAGLEVFSQHGYAAATVEEITERANVGRTTFYTHFQSKADVAFAVASAQGLSLNASVASLGEARPGDRASVSAWLDRVARQSEQQSVLVTLVVQAIVAGPEIAEHFIDVQRRSAEAAVRQLVDAGWRPTERTTQRLMLLITLVVRWMHTHVVQRVAMPEGSRDALIDLVLAELDTLRPADPEITGAASRTERPDSGR